MDKASGRLVLGLIVVLSLGIAPPEVKKLGLMRVRIESRYYTKLRAKLAR